MKKSILVLAAFVFASFKLQEPKEKNFIVSAPVATWETVLDVIDLSTAEPKQRIAVRNFIVGQLNDTTINKVK